MNPQVTPHDLTALRAQIAAQGAELRRLRADLPRPARGLARRCAPLILAALMIALRPLVTLAANPFGDLNNGSPHNGNIDAIFNAGITTGCDATSYCPNGNVTREEMASFLARTAGLGGNSPVVNAKTAQTAANAAQLGGIPAANYVQANSNATLANLTVTGAINKAYTSGTANRAAPLAYGTVSASGVLQSGTPNLAVVYNDAAKTYTITITGETYNITDYQTVVTPISGVYLVAIAEASNDGKLVIRVYNSGPTLVADNFSFIVFKP